MKNSITKIAYILCLLFTFVGAIQAQVGINNVNPNNAAVLDLGGTDRGFLLPRLTGAQRVALPSPVQGLMIYDTEMDMPFYFRSTSTSWQMMSPFVSQSATESRLHTSVEFLRLFQGAAGVRRLHVNGGVSITAANDDPSADFSLRVQNNVNVGGDVTLGGKITAATIEITGGIPPSAGVVPIGGIIMWSGLPSAIPAGWALCDGQSGRPDLRGRFVVGYHDAIPQYDATRKLGKNASDTTTTLVMANLPAHNHAAGTLVANSAGAHSHSVSASTGGGGTTINADNDSSIEENPSTSTAGDHTHSIGGSTANAGSGTAFGNRPPWYVLAYIIRIN